MKRKDRKIGLKETIFGRRTESWRNACCECICMRKPRSQVCVLGVAKLSWRNHMVQNLRAYFILYVITIKWVIRVQEKIELSSI